jgi:hypothetical protein
MARTTGVAHATYQLTTGDGILPGDLALHSSKLAALEHAVDNGAKYVPWPHGKTLAEAIAEFDAAKARAKQGRTPGTLSSSTPPSTKAPGA